MASRETEVINGAKLVPDSRVRYFGHSWQYDCRGLEQIPNERRPEFLICLYFTVLVDQAMHAHFRPHYAKFESLTRYPKFCHGLGQFQKNPRDIFLTPIDKGMVEKEKVDRLLAEGMRLFVDELVGFCTQHMPEINPDEFFGKLLFDPDVQIPAIVVLLNPEMKNDTGVIAYEALEKAVEGRMKVRAKESR